MTNHRRLLGNLERACFFHRHEVRLHPGQLTMTPCRRQIPADDEGASYAPMTTVVHLSDGDTRVEKLHSPDTFTLITHKNTYQ